MKVISLLLATCAVGLCAVQNSENTNLTVANQMHSADEAAAEAQKPLLNRGEITEVMAGQYLASRFAQTNHDWKTANKYLGEVMQETGIAQTDMLQRAMILAMGAGDVERAIKIAEQSKKLSPQLQNSIADVFVITKLIKENKYKDALNMFNALPQDGTVKFIGPFMDGWINAGTGTLKIDNLRANTVQLYHSILISDFLNDHSVIEKMIDNSLKVENINYNEMERIADLYAHVGQMNKATDLYQKILKAMPESPHIRDKIKAIENNENKNDLFKKIETAQQGMAQAFFDIANILYNEANDESARVFAHMALYLDNNQNEARFLLGEISTKHKQFKTAVSFYNAVPKDDEAYLRAQHDIVDVYEEAEDFDMALSVLEGLQSQDKSVDTLIKIGDLHRHQEDYKNALKYYDMATTEMGGEITEEFWYLHYLRGIALEQLDRWNESENELKTALSYRPDEPYVLNYLGYAWADKGINLEQAQDMIQRAVDARPNDGYIRDSLGWVYFRTQNFDQAAATLEKAVELLPYDPTVNDHLGDAYWRVGRKLEARFQWERARNYAEEDEIKKTISEKLEKGMPPIDAKNMK